MYRMMILNDADFKINGIVQFELFGQKLWITTTHLSLLMVTIALMTLGFCAHSRMKKAKDIPDTFQNILELIVEQIQNMVSGMMGKNGTRFVAYIGTLFMFILFCNLAGLFGLRAPTADFGVTFTLGIFTFLIVNFQGIKNNKLKHFTALFQPFPLLFPINVIGELANPFSLSLRLFGNMLSGVIIMGLWYGMMPIFVKLGIPAFLHIYFDFFSGAIQTYVFCMLTMVYVNEKMI